MRAVRRADDGGAGVGGTWSSDTGSEERERAGTGALGGAESIMVMLAEQDVG